MSMDPTGLGAPIGSNRNARVAHIRKFVCVPPERGHVLRLVAIDDPPTVLGEWPRVQCADNGITAEEVDAFLREHANATGERVTANLTWCAENHLVVTTKRLKCEPEANSESALVDPSDKARMEALGLDGSNKGNAVQLSRALEGQIRLFMNDAQTRRAEDRAQARVNIELVQTMGAIAREGWAAAHAANIEADKLRQQQRRELDQAALAVRESVDSESEESGARAELIKMVTGAFVQALPLIVNGVSKMLAENSNAAAPPPAAAAE